MTMWARFRALWGPDPQRDVEDELSFHLEMRERELIARGTDPARARELALRRFGDVDSPRAQCVTISERQGRRMARTEYIDELRQDVAYAVRSLRKRPGFTLVAVLTLALGIGASSAIFSVVNGVLLRSLPYANAERLYLLQMVYSDGARYSSMSGPDFMSLAELNRVFEAVGGYETGRAPVVGLGEPREVRDALVTDGLFAMMEMPLLLGRTFTSEEHQPGNNLVAVLDHGFWQRELGGATDVVGSTISMRGGTVEIIGVLAPGAALPWPAEVYRPQPYDEAFDVTALEGRRSEFLSVLGRARPGVTAAAVEADVRRIGAQLSADFPATNDRVGMSVVPLRDRITGDVRRPLLVLLGAVGFVLLVACANVANLLLARASARQSELAVRAALGAGRGRLVRQLLTESAVLGLLGGAAGLALAYVGTRALVNAQPADIPRLDSIGIDTTVVLVTLGVALLTGLLFGAMPALQSTGAALSQRLRAGSRGSGGSAGQRLRSGLIVAEMALAVMLLMGAGLLIRSFVELTRVDPGFQPSQAMAVRIAMDAGTYPDGARMGGFVDELMQRIDGVGGVQSVAGTATLPMRGRGDMFTFAVVGAPLPPDNVNREIGVFSVTPGYFATIGAELLHGRDFTPHDNADAPLVALINEAAARFWFGGEDPVGRRVDVSGTEREVVGVVADVLQRAPGSAVRPQLFRPYAQNPSRSLQLVVRTAGDPVALAPTLRSLIRSMDPNMPLGQFTPLEQVAAEAVARPRFYTSLLTLFAAVALALAAIGIFGVMSYSVTQRAREISIRMALGADRGSVIAMIVRASMLLAGLGLLLGVAGALVLGRVLSSQLFNVTVADPLTVAGVVAVLAGSAFVASLLPARRAARLDPGMALRE
jgi:putative ABC transport system permease protein